MKKVDPKQPFAILKRSGDFAVKHFPTAHSAAAEMWGKAMNEYDIYKYGELVRGVPAAFFDMRDHLENYQPQSVQMRSKSESMQHDIMACVDGFLENLPAQPTNIAKNALKDALCEIIVKGLK